MFKVSYTQRNTHLVRINSEIETVEKAMEQLLHSWKTDSDFSHGRIIKDGVKILTVTASQFRAEEAAK